MCDAFPNRNCSMEIAIQCYQRNIKFTAMENMSFVFQICGMFISPKLLHPLHKLACLFIISVLYIWILIRLESCIFCIHVELQVIRYILSSLWNPTLFRTLFPYVLLVINEMLKLTVQFIPKYNSRFKHLCISCCSPLYSQ